MAHVTEQLNTALADRYRIERELGQGGMALVYLATDLKHDRKVALKILRPELAAVIGAERFLNEIKVTANLQHPHILPLHDSGEASTFLYYVMPYIEGETLRTKLDKEKQFGVKEAVEISKHVASALDYAHRQGVIHRDIKPENVLLHDGQALVADFGIALAVSHAGGNRLTETGLSVGTPHYMSPEQAMGDRELDARSDVYSLGAMLYEMLTGEPPYTGATAQAIVARVITEEPRPLTSQRRTVPANVAAAVHQALSKMPADRFSTAAEFAAALENAAFTSMTGSSTTAPPTVPTSGRSRATIALAAFGIAASALAAWGWLRSSPPPPSNRFRIALTEHAIAPGLVGRDLALSPDGRTIVFSDTAGGERKLWIKTADRAEAEPLTGTTSGRAPAFSPDGEWVAFVADGRLRKVPRVGGSPVTIADSAQPDLPSVAWLENGTVAFSDGSFRLRVVDQDGGLVRTFSVTDSLVMGVVSIGGLPGGRGVLLGLCAFGCPTSRLVALDLESGDWESLSEEVIRGWSLSDGHVVFVRPDGGVFAAPFDAGKLRFTSTPVPVLEGVRTVIASPDLALSQNGTLLFVPGEAGVSSAPVEVVWVDRTGVATPVDSGWAIVPSGNGGIALSPDGRRLALAVQASGSEDIWIKELDRGPFTRLTFEGSNLRPAWSADGRSVLYVSALPDGNYDLRRRRADGTSAPETLLDAARTLFEVLPTLDTAEFLLRLGGAPTRDIYLFRRGPQAGDSTIAPLVASDGYEEVAIALSPDGRWLAYGSNESGRFEVYVRPFPDVNGGRWQISGSGGNEPKWAHSGRELFYRAANGNLVAVTVNPGTAFSIGEQRVLFSASPYMNNPSYPEYALSQDDRRFLFKRFVGLQEGGAQTTTAVLVQHWLTELRTGRPSR